MISERKPRCGDYREVNSGSKKLLYVEVGFLSLKVFMQNIEEAIDRDSFISKTICNSEISWLYKEKT